MYAGTIPKKKEKIWKIEKVTVFERKEYFLDKKILYYW